VPTLYRRALRKGLLGGSRPWFYLWAGLAGFKILRRLARDEPEIVYSERLEPGQRLLITSGEREPRVFGG
jgi:hypothetical protein